MKRINSNQIMENLEKKVVDNVYRFERKRSTTSLVVYAALIIIFLSIFSFAIINTINILRSQQTLDLFEIFNEDIEIIRQYLGDVLITLYMESPKLLLSIVLIFAFLFITTFVFLVKNFTKIRNRLKSTYRFFGKGGEKE